jgi:hypothetical protein
MVIKDCARQKASTIINCLRRHWMRIKKSEYKKDENVEKT